ncbi:MAG: phosphoribosylglycinamide formyltransferase [Methylococcales bacterium]|nr:phosphoribosylglycinamide formyltransferase [Methylococcales bacterium]
MYISFLASHGGSSVKHIIHAINEGELNARIGGVITNNHNSDIFRWCSENNINIVHISDKTHVTEVEKDLVILNTLKQWNTSVVVLSGYMKKIGSKTLRKYQNKILNIHPSLLPKYGGKGMYGNRVHTAVLNSGDKFSGATVQFINEEYDEGPIIIQRKIPVKSSDTVQSLRARVMAVEGSLYVQALKKIMK